MAFNQGLMTVPQNPFSNQNPYGSLGYFAPGQFAVPQNPLASQYGAYGASGLGYFAPGQFAVPQNPLHNQLGLGGVVPVPNAHGVSGLGGLGGLGCINCQGGWQNAYGWSSPLSGCGGMCNGKGQGQGQGAWSLTDPTTWGIGTWLIVGGLAWWLLFGGKRGGGGYSLDDLKDMLLGEKVGRRTAANPRRRRRVRMLK